MFCLLKRRRITLVRSPCTWSDITIVKYCVLVVVKEKDHSGKIPKWSDLTIVKYCVLFVVNEKDHSEKIPTWSDLTIIKYCALYVVKEKITLVRSPRGLT